MAAFVLSETDADTLRRMIAWWRAQDPTTGGGAASIIAGAAWAARPVEDYQRRIFLGKTTASHAKGATQAVDLYGTFGEAQGSETKQADDFGNDAEIDVYNRFAAVDNDKWVLCVPVGGGYELIAAEC